jgi:hypothetical protein
MIAPIRMEFGRPCHQTRWLALLPSSAPMAFELAMKGDCLVARMVLLALARLAGLSACQC